MYIIQLILTIWNSLLDPSERHSLEHSARQLEVEKGPEIGFIDKDVIYVLYLL